MTIFEQTISNTEVQMAMPIYTSFLLYGLLVFPILVFLITKIPSHSDHKDTNEEKENNTSPNIIDYAIGIIGIIGIFAFFGLIIFITQYALLSTVHFVPPLQLSLIHI